MNLRGSAQRLLLVSIGIALAATPPAAGHVGTFVYPIYELPTADLPDLRDGTLDDWEDVLPDAVLDQSHFTAEGAGAADASTFAFRVFLAWHHASQRIYFAVERVDDVYLPPGPGFSGEGVTTLLVDGDHSGGQYYFYEQEGYSATEVKRMTCSQAQFYTVRPEELDGELIYVPDQLRWTAGVPWADVGGSQSGDSPNLSVVEMTVSAWDNLNWEGPELSERSRLEAGRVIGFDIQMQDFDEEGFPAGSYRMALPTRFGEVPYRHWEFADNFIDGWLVPCDTGDCSRGPNTAVVGDSWGRIKASFR